MSTHAASHSTQVAAFRIAEDAIEYCVDAWQRSILTLDVMRERSERYEQQAAKIAPHVLKFDCELVMDGRELKRPVNYVLVRIKPPADAAIEETRRPFVVVDPRAGHGPGIGGFKADSEIGVAFKAGHPCYFIGFLPEPVPGQTIEDVAHAEAAFLERVIALHPAAEGKPAVIGNCQAGWAVMLLASLRPELFGPIIIAGSPLSYWTGLRGQNPMRYTGGMLGGSWLTAFAGDLGKGTFDGAWLVSNFENLNPANTLWSKQYNLYEKIDKEASRYLEFEQWWGAHVLLNAEEMQYIADELFIGNRLAAGSLKTSDGAQVDLKNIESPILVFCSKADNITPPQQALGWILDLYGSVDDIRAHGQTIVYAIHESIGHLGIFVSGSVAKKEHDEFATNIDLIDVLPPGLYEAVMTPKSAEEAASDVLIGGDYLVRFEARTIDDIRALGGNDDADDRMFQTVARLSDINLGLYRTFFEPWVRSFMTDGMAETLRRLHPLRVQYDIYSAANPFMTALASTAQNVRQTRRPVSSSNIFWQAQACLAGCVETSLDAYREARDGMLEATFDAIYGSPLLQAIVGLKAGKADARRPPATTAAHSAVVKQRIVEIKRRAADGGPREAALRCLIYAKMPDDVIDERGFNLLRTMRQEAGKGYSLKKFKRVFRDQFLMLLLDERDAMNAVPGMLAKDPNLSRRMEGALRSMIDAVALRTDAAKARWGEVQRLFEEVNGHRKAAADNRDKRAPLATLRRVHMHHGHPGKHSSGGGKHQ
jgi:pimeloyl-ACP methyl ester carboxylesterase